MGAIKHVFFDLDGTLADQFVAIHKGFSTVAREFGFPEPTLKTVIKSVGGSIPLTAERLFGDLLNESKKEAFVNAYRELFPSIMYEGLVAMPGAAWILDGLAKQGISSSVLTNKHGDFARAACDFLKLTPLLKDIVGTQDSPYRKPEKGIVDFAMQRADAQPEHSCMVGDSPFDEATAISGSMPCYLVSTGSHSREQLEDECNSPIFKDFYELGISAFGLPQPTEA